MKLLPSVLAAALAATLGAAHADPISLTPTGNGGYTGSFVQSSSDLFFDSFTFSPASFGGLVSVTLMNVRNVNFFVGLINDQSFGYYPETGPDFSFRATVDASMPVTLTVYGAAVDAAGNLGMGNTGTYRGTVNVAAAVPAVPEPSTGALLFGGLAAAAWVASKRRKIPARAP